MRRHKSRSYLDPITDRLRPKVDKNATGLPGVILFAAVVGVIPLAYTLDWLTGAGWLGSALGAIAITAILAAAAFKLIGK